jgi:hypothetical protein
VFWHVFYLHAVVHNDIALDVKSVLDEEAGGTLDLTYINNEIG